MQPEILICPFCHTESSMGVKVCKGCQAEIKYNETPASAMVLVVIGIVITLFIALLIKTTMGSFIIGLIIGVIVAIFAVKILGKALKIKWNKDPMFYRQMKH